jgi:hypothetical protein
MSDELRLPDRLAACEAELAAQPLPASTINRDELLYRAGWAAAEAEFSSGALVPASTAWSKRGIVATWSAASAALAASIAVAVTLSLVAPREQSIAIRTLNAPPRAAILEDRPHTEPAGQRTEQRVVVDALLARLDALTSGTTAVWDSAPNASIWAWTRKPDLGPWDQPILVTSAVTSPAPAGVSSTTARELLDQMLPGRAKADANASKRSGVLEILRPLGWGGDTI